MITKTDWYFWSLMIIGMISVTAIVIYQSESASAIPPTPSFAKVFVNGDEIKAKKYNDILNITTEGIIITEVNENANNVIMKLDQFSCPLLQVVIGFNENGEPICGLL